MAKAYLEEFQNAWPPHTKHTQHTRLLELLESQSPLLIAGAFTRAVPMGCLATHIAWHHPATSRMNEDAGICWLSRIAGLNPATSSLILKWDRDGIHDRELRAQLMAACRLELDRREGILVEDALCCGA